VKDSSHYSITRADHDRVWFVVITMRDGSTAEEAFSNRTLAEAYLEYLSFGIVDAASAKLRPSTHGDN
jgi:hypothetical protein